MTARFFFSEGNLARHLPNELVQRAQDCLDEDRQKRKHAVMALSCPKQDRVEINSCNFVGIWHGLTP